MNGTSELLGSDHRRLTKAYQEQLDSLKLRLPADSPFFEKNPTFVVLPKSYRADLPSGEGYSARALAYASIIEIRESVVTRCPDEVIRAIVFHEMVHLHLGQELRRPFLDSYNDINTFFHTVIIRDWLEGKVALTYDDDYLTSKDWAALYDGWAGPSNVTLEKVIDCVENYFFLLRKNRLTDRDHPMFYQPTIEEREHTRSWQDIPIEHLYSNDSQDTVTKIVTGFELMDYLGSAYRSSFGLTSISQLEENLANYIGTTLASISIEQMGRYAKQDLWKTNRLAQLQQARLSPETILRRVQTYQDLQSFFADLPQTR